MFGIPPRRLIALIFWLLLGVAAASVMWRAAQRPRNLHADSVTLQPRSGDYGPVTLSVIKLGAAPNADGHTALLLLNAKHTGGLIIGLPNLTYTPAGGRTVQLSEAPLTEDDLSRLLAGPYSAQPPARAEVVELLDLMRSADGQGLGTRVEHFRLVDAKPWHKHWWLRRSRPLYWVALWLAVGWGLWRWSGREPEPDLGP